MIEQQLEKLIEQQNQTNELLGEILSALKDAPTTPQRAVNKPTAKKTKKAEKPVELVKSEYTLNDIQEAFIEAKERDSREAALDIVFKIAGEVKKLPDVPQDKFAELIAAFKDHNAQVAA